jgi:hypothetical protein
MPGHEEHLKSITGKLDVYSRDRSSFDCFFKPRNIQSAVSFIDVRSASKRAQFTRPAAEEGQTGQQDYTFHQLACPDSSNCVEHDSSGKNDEHFAVAASGVVDRA